MNETDFHPVLLNAVRHHQEFYSGKRSCLIKVSLGIVESDEKDLSVISKLHAIQGKFIPGVPYDGLDWKHDF